MPLIFWWQYRGNLHPFQICVIRPQTYAGAGATLNVCRPQKLCKHPSSNLAGNNPASDAGHWTGWTVKSRPQTTRLTRRRTCWLQRTFHKREGQMLSNSLADTAENEDTSLTQTTIASYRFFSIPRLHLQKVGRAVASFKPVSNFNVRGISI